MTRELWIDRPFASYEYRVRELTEGGTDILGTFATREQAEIFMDEILNPPPPEPEPIEDPAPKEPERPGRTWTHGVSP